MGKLSGRVAIITGASSGIGRATAELFCEEGAAVVLASRNSERLERVTEQIEQQGGECMAIATDVSKQSDVIHLVQTSLKHFNHVDILVNNAGAITEPGPLSSMDESKWDQLFSTNTKSVYWTTRAVWPTMEKQRSGVIVNTASVIAFKGVSGMAAYCASKAAVVMLTKVLAIEGAPIGLRVNCVCPGFIDTPMTDWVGSQQPDSEAWLIDMHENIPLNRSGRPEEVARASLFLSSDESSYVTGETIMVDGGVTT